MNHADKLMSIGADCVGGVLIYKNKELGRFRNGVFDINDEGLRLVALDITDVEPKVKPKAKKVKDEPKAAEQSVDDLSDLDTLLD